MRLAKTARDRNSKTCAPIFVRAPIDREVRPSKLGGRVHEPFELGAFCQADLLRKKAAHTRVSCLRPARRRRLMILRPLAVLILLRKPCSALRRLLLGWYVRFTGGFLAKII